MRLTSTCFAAILAAMFSFTGIANDQNNGFHQLVEIRLEDVTTATSDAKFGAHAVLVPGFAMFAAPLLTSNNFGEGGVFLFRINAGANPPVRFIRQLERFGDTLSLGQQGQAMAGDGDWLAVSQNNGLAVTLHQRNAGGPGNWGLAQSLEPPEELSYRPGAFGGDGQEYPTLDIHGNLLIVSDYMGDLLADDGVTQVENSAGFAFVYELAGNTWTLIERLENPFSDPNELEDFGRAVAIYDGPMEDIAVVGAPGTNIDANTERVGEAYVFTRPAGSQSWVLKATLVGEGLDSRQAADEFGRSVDVDGNAIAVGTSNGWNAVSNAGSVHIFDRNQGGLDNWGEITELAAGIFSDNYSKALQLRSGSLIVGAPAIGAYMYKRDQNGPDAWGLVQQLTSSEPEFNDEIGSSVALLGGYVAIGDRGRNTRNGSIGRAGSGYIFF